MINLKHYQNLSTDYYHSLNLKDVSKEFNKCGIMTVNLKTEKGENVDILFEGVPANLIKDFNSCVDFSNCLRTCLYFSGMNNLFQSKSGKLSTAMMKRIRRMFLLKNDAELFFRLVKRDIETALLNARFENVKCGVRMNGYTDINFSKFQSNILKDFKEVNFYDYSKDMIRKQVAHTTFSYNGGDLIPFFEKLSSGHNVAVVFSVTKKKNLPKEWHGFKVIDGDLSDARYNDEKGVVVGLRVKNTIKGKDLRDENFVVTV